MSNGPATTPPAPEVSTDELASALEAGAYVLDVRRHEEYADKHVPEVVLIPLDELGARVDEVPTDRPVWVICAAFRQTFTEEIGALISCGFSCEA